MRTCCSWLTRLLKHQVMNPKNGAPARGWAANLKLCPTRFGLAKLAKVQVNFPGFQCRSVNLWGENDQPSRVGQSENLQLGLQLIEEQIRHSMPDFGLGWSHFQHKSILNLFMSSLLASAQRKGVKDFYLRAEAKICP